METEKLIARHAMPYVVLIVLLFNSESGQAQTAPIPNAAYDHAVVEALLRTENPSSAILKLHSQSVNRFVDGQKGTPKFLSTVDRLNLRDSAWDLMPFLLADQFSTSSVDAARVLLRFSRIDLLQIAVDDTNDAKASSAIKALGFVEFQDRDPMLELILIDSSRSPVVRTAAASALGRSLSGQRVLLRLAKEGKVPGEAEFAAADALLGSHDSSIRSEAAKHVKPAAGASNTPIPPISELLKVRGDAAEGKKVFDTTGTCIKCHKVRGEGKEVGPDLSEIGSKLARDEMFSSILNPNAAVSHNYETYTLLTADGKVITGVLVNQSKDAVTIRTAEAVDQTVAAADVENLKKQTVSLMPADLQKNLSIQNLVDVVDYMGLLKKSEEAAFNDLLGSPVTAAASHAATDAIQGLEVAEGLELQLFAAEPQMLSPTSIDVDSRGRVWVCETVNYRHFRNPYNRERKEGDRILVLVDSDGDAKADQTHVFYQGADVDSAHGVCVLGNRVIVSAGDKVLVFTDKDGDLKADDKQVLFSGIGGVQHDHGIHAFCAGPDGKLYFNFGNEGGQLLDASGKPIIDKAGNRIDSSRHPYQQGMVFRCNLDGSGVETLAWNFRNNWELCVDSFGTIWQSDNDDDGFRGTRINYVMEFGNYGYRDELTGDTWQTGRMNLETDIQHRHWHLNDPGVVPNLLQTGAGSPTGITFYEGKLLPEKYQNQIIHCDPGPNVVRAYPVKPKGAGYEAAAVNLVRGVQDQWFRPVDVSVAPDGSLFIADWYDPGVGGHRMGDADRGRIFRVTTKQQLAYEPQASSESEASSALHSPNLETRYLAQQEIRQSPESHVPPLEEQFFNSFEKEPRLRARALWMLCQLPEHGESSIVKAIFDSDPEIRVVAIRLARQLGHDLKPIITQLVKDPSPQVRRELAIALRSQSFPDAARLWAELAAQHDGQDRWYLEALGIGAEGQWDSYLAAWQKLVGDRWDTAAGRDIIWRSRAKQTSSLLAKLILQSKSADEQLRYFRALDFQAPETQQTALEQILVGN